ncbi:hypothetical protein [Virgibacillus proomii]|uniref:hypothetical protein n=1 Tax=Virgibacillus proomii TaxID=84407 RepID=UPI0009868D34|nr:hypothetical protein [Virgibacillus proomii]
MNKTLDQQTIAELKLYIRDNGLNKAATALKRQFLANDSTTVYSPSSPPVDTYYGKGIFGALKQRIKRVKNTYTLGEYVESLLNERNKSFSVDLEKFDVDRFYKNKVIKNKINPSKQKLLCFAVALRLNIEETDDLLRWAGLTLAEENSVFDNIIGYFIEKEIYDPIEIDQYLVEFGESPMFSVE